MNRGLGLCIVALLVILGCKTAPPPPPVREAIPPPFTVNGAIITLVDERPQWEREPVSGGKITMYRLGRVHPNPWEQVARETGAIVAEMAEKPERVEVLISSFRLVRKEDKLTIMPDPSNNPGVGRPSNLAAGMNQSDQKPVTVDAPDIPVQNDAAAKPTTGPNFADHPLGASCRLQATIRMKYPGGREQSYPVQVIAAGAQPRGSNYYGEALDSAANLAVRLYRVRLRQALGIQSE